MNTSTEDIQDRQNISTEFEGGTDSTCEPCAHAAKHAWWGPSLAPARSHCRDCHRSWASPREGHCTRCHAHFSDVRAFDYHMGEEGCSDPALAQRADGRPRLVLKERAFGGVWSVVDYRTHTRPYESKPVSSAA